MDTKYKHFNHEAVFKASQESVLDAARTVVAESLGEFEATTDGFVARGYSGWHPAIATVHITPVPDGIKVAVELLVERAAIRSYMLVDIGGYYNGQVDKWFSGIAQRLGDPQEQILVSKTTGDVRVRRGCFIGCLVYLVVGMVLGIIAIPLNSALFPQSSASFQGPFTVVAALLGLLAGIAAFLYMLYPDAPASKSIRERLPGNRDKERQ